MEGLGGGPAGEHSSSHPSPQMAILESPLQRHRSLLGCQPVHWGRPGPGLATNPRAACFCADVGPSVSVDGRVSVPA